MVAKVWVVLIFNTPSTSATSAEKASDSVSNAPDTRGAIRRPASLSVTRRFERTKSGTPSRSSNKRI